MQKWVLIGLAGMVVGIIGWGGFNTALEATNQMAFCISCHEMRDTVYGEYQQSPHFQNPSGVRATCTDCHVPRDWSHKLIRKIKASGELFHWAIGSIDTLEKFEAKRHTLAIREWDRMRASDSQECRNCHSFEAMAFHKQSIKAARAMRDAAKAGKTCIDCHKAIAHKMPDVTAHHRRMFTALSAAAEKTFPAVGDMVTGLESRPLFASPHAEPEGQLKAGHAVQVLAVAEGFVKIDISGWRRDGAQTIVYVRPGKRITLANLEEPALARLRPGRMVEDADTGQAWTETHLEAWVPAGGFLRDPQPLWDYAERMVEDNCTLCHIRRPAAAYLANDWIGHVNSMKRLTPLSDAEADLLLTYLQRQAKDGEK